MAKHIHVYLPKGMTLRAPAKDAGEFKEDQHPRDKGGKFTTSGAAGGNAAYHAAKADEHTKAMGTAKGAEEVGRHKILAAHHQKAAEHLAHAIKATNPTVQAQHMAKAQEHADRVAAKTPQPAGVKNEIPPGGKIVYPGKAVEAPVK